MQFLTGCRGTASPRQTLMMLKYGSHPMAYSRIGVHLHSFSPYCTCAFPIPFYVCHRTAHVVMVMQVGRTRQYSDCQWEDLVYGDLSGQYISHRNSRDEVFEIRRGLNMVCLLSTMNKT